MPSPECADVGTENRNKYYNNWEQKLSTVLNITKADVVRGVGVLVEQGSVDPLLRQPKDDLVLALGELQLGVVRLAVNHVPDVLVPVALPLLQSVHLVQRNHERDLLLLEHVETLEGLGLETVHDVYD